MNWIVKLGDFGTTEIGIEGNISVGQFTTFENTPPEYLLCDSCTRGATADVWNLGLSLAHLLIESAPYEEVMKDCVCSQAFSRLCHSYWNKSSFRVLRDVLKDDESDLLCLTLYRQCVLWFRFDSIPHGNSSPLWNRLYSILSGQSTRSRHEESIRQKFEEDQLHYSWWFGDHPLIMKARERGEAIPHLQEVLRNLTQFDCTLRMSYEDLLKHPVFAPLQKKSARTSGDSVYSIDVEKLRGIMNRQL
ncbi:serine/threonine protein kinase [Blastocystis sp. subtype 4]|uniref:serine/threonine protein kinase n=1 Tax=Blastocystis sp. subtype 4 TaxID=944170 RepID=UPI0007116B81|nr:serine/threonine protein kinase [Blastocystis sp. subtype 4]KNB43383.1 serine/threonine protein kinase [Blastocystis sp. subtype 4]|eukprot:XP_014526820.1 serine/threonine protein kinase [Blastocystis sp. subtype 4]